MQSRNKFPPELHIVHGTQGKNQGITLPEKLKQYTPVAYWLKNPEQWDQEKFIETTAKYLYELYGIGSEQDQHVLGMLADHMTTYVECVKGIKLSGVIAKYNGGKTFGPSPHVSLRDKVTPRIISLMNELGLTPRGRLTGNATDDVHLGDLMAGPDNFK
jgi:phage terminase small subunit